MVKMLAPYGCLVVVVVVMMMMLIDASCVKLQ
jgi:hypothetical protein